MRNTKSKSSKLPAESNADQNTSSDSIEDKKKDSFLATYQSLLARYPLLINGIQSALIAGVAVIITYFINNFNNQTEKQKDFDYVELRAMMLINLCFITPVLLNFFKYLNSWKAHLLVKLFVDQILFSPILNTCIIGLRMFLIGVDISEIPNQLIEIAPKAIYAAWMFWIPIRFITLVYIPATYHLIFGNICGLFWNILLTLILSN
eukprot:gene4659-6546_t